MVEKKASPTGRESRPKNMVMNYTRKSGLPDFKQETLVEYLTNTFQMMEDTRETKRWNYVWKLLRDYFLPRSGPNEFSQWMPDKDTEENWGEILNQKIPNDTAGVAVDKISAGLMSGITNKAMSWFVLQFPEGYEPEDDEVDWIELLEKKLRDIFLSSNLYDVLMTVYEELAVYGTSAIGVFDDDEDFLWFEHYTIGSYCVANDEKDRVNKFFRRKAMTVENMVREFAWKDGQFDERNYKKLSEQVRSNYEHGYRSELHYVVECILPAEDRTFDGEDQLMEYRDTEDGPVPYPFIRVIYEENQQTQDLPTNILFKSGYMNFPIVVPRWYMRKGYTYGLSPCMRALGNTIQLQETEKYFNISLGVNAIPALQGPASLAHQKMNFKAGAVNPVLSSNPAANKGFESIYRGGVRVDHLLAAIERKEHAIRKMLFTELFEAIKHIDKSNATATEIHALRNEQYLQLAPLMSSLETNFLKPLVNLSIFRVQDQGLIKEAPPNIHNMKFTPQYLSIVAIAVMGQARETLTLFENLVSDMTAKLKNFGHVDTPDDIIKWDELIRLLAKQLKITGKVLRSEDEVRILRESRRQSMEAIAAQEAAASNGTQGVASPIMPPGQSETMLPQPTPTEFNQPSLGPITDAQVGRGAV